VKFKYKKLPAFCFKCGRILHKASGCPIPSSKRSNHKGVWGWGSWIRVEDPSNASNTADGCPIENYHHSQAEVDDDPKASSRSNHGHYSQNGNPIKGVTPSAEIKENVPYNLFCP